VAGLTAARKAKIAARAAKNILAGRPVTVSFEVTYNCNARCEHCDLGNYVKEPRLGPEAFAGWIAQLRPAVAQISGGEPLLRKDLANIVSEMRRQDPVAVFVLTTNVSLLNEEKYLKLKHAGVDQFSFSLDYPDERHNEFRHLKRNFQHIRNLCHKLGQNGNCDIILACVVQSDNFRDLPRMAELAADWGVAVNFSTYNALRTGKRHFLISAKNDQRELGRIVDRLVSMQRDGYPIVTSEWTLRQMISFFKNGRQPDCQAGRRFLIVGPWAKLTPCGMFRDKYETHPELKREFTARNRCADCYTAIRANSEKSPYRLLVDAFRAVRRR
jgi:MoaA/NifB/PqqE/SkfB family radical SAM enzyme